MLSFSRRTSGTTGKKRSNEHDHPRNHLLCARLRHSWRRGRAERPGFPAASLCDHATRTRGGVAARRMKQLSTTSGLTAGVIEILTLHGYTVWRNNAGKARNNIRLSPPGTPDIIGYAPDGRFVGIEIKVGRDKPNPDQLEWREKAHASNCRVCFVRSIDDIESMLKTGAIPCS